MQKEVKKLSRPYLETKVVKIKKPRYSCREVIEFMGKKYEVFIEDGKVSIKRHKHQKPKGNWVNGENLDKIKFPVPCSYMDCKKNYGMLVKGIDDCGLSVYELFNIDRQSDMNRVHSMSSLAELIERYDIHILKGKIILFEEEE